MSFCIRSINKTPHIYDVSCVIIIYCKIFSNFQLSFLFVCFCVFTNAQEIRKLLLNPQIYGDFQIMFVCFWLNSTMHFNAFIFGETSFFCQHTVKFCNYLCVFNHFLHMSMGLYTNIYMNNYIHKKKRKDWEVLLS